MGSKVVATWSASLDCECPHCKEDVDLLDYDGFWEGRKIQIAESRTKGTTDMEVVCPNCAKEFLVDCAW